jgi:peptidyl-prolyl cis-trans isomerase SurA
VQARHQRCMKNRNVRAAKKLASRIAVLLLLATAVAIAQVASHAPTGVMSAPPAAGTASGQSLDQPVARVNGAVLTQRDLLREMYAMFPYARQHGGGMPKSMEPEIRKGALDMIVFEELVYQEALRRKLVIPAARITSAEAAFRKQFPSAEKFQEYLKFECQGSKQVLRRKIRRSLLIEAVLKTDVTDKSAVTLAEARSYYEKNPKEFEHNETLSLQTISIIPPAKGGASVQAEARKRAEDALREAKATKSYKEFGLLAEKVSDDDWHVNMGDRKNVDVAKLPPPLVAAARKMKIGEVSDLLQFGPNFTLFRLNGRTPAGKAKFDDVKARLKTELQKSKAERLRADLDKKLRRTAKVEML